MSGIGDLHRSLNGETRPRPPSTHTSAGRAAHRAFLDDDADLPDERGRVRRWWDQDPDDDGEPERACSCEHRKGCEAGLYRPPSLATRLWRAHRARVKARKAQQRAAAPGARGGRRR